MKLDTDLFKVPTIGAGGCITSFKMMVATVSADTPLLVMYAPVAVAVATFAYVCVKIFFLIKTRGLTLRD